MRPSPPPEWIFLCKCRSPYQRRCGVTLKAAPGTVQLSPDLADVTLCEPKPAGHHSRLLSGCQQLGDCALPLGQSAKPRLEVDPRDRQVGGRGMPVLDHDVPPAAPSVDLVKAFHLHAVATLAAQRHDVADVQTVANRSPLANPSDRVGSQRPGIRQVCAAEFQQPHEGSPGVVDRGVDRFAARLGIPVAEGHERVDGRLAVTPRTDRGRLFRCRCSWTSWRWSPAVIWQWQSWDGSPKGATRCNAGVRMPGLDDCMATSTCALWHCCSSDGYAWNAVVSPVFQRINRRSHGFTGGRKFVANVGSS
jgi:hypothetical protein